jgi:hypothetical protein
VTQFHEVNPISHSIVTLPFKQPVYSSWRLIARTGLRVTLAVTASLIVLGIMSYALICLVGVSGQ